MNNFKLSLGLLIALIGFPQISETIYAPALPDVAIGLATTAHRVEETLAIYFFGFAFGVLFWGILSDWMGRRLAMLGGLLIYGIGCEECISVESVDGLLWWRFIQSFGASVGSVITQTIIRDVYDGVQRTKTFSIITGALAFSPALGPLLGGFLSEYWGWRSNFTILVVVAIVLFICCLLLLPETRPANVARTSFNKIGSIFLDMLKSPVLWGHILLISATNGIIFGFYQEAPFIFIDQLGIKPSHYGFIGLLISAATVLSSHITYKKSQVHTPEYMILWGARLTMMGAIALILTVATGIFNANIMGIILFLLILFLIFFGVGLIIPSSLSHALKPYHSAPGTAGSVFGFCYCLLIAMSMWMMSVIHNGSAFPMPLYIGFLGIVLMIAGKMIKSELALNPSA